MYKPNTIFSRFDCLRSDVKHESWEQLKVIHQLFN